MVLLYFIKSRGMPGVSLAMSAGEKKTKDGQREKAEEDRKTLLRSEMYCFRYFHILTNLIAVFPPKNIASSTTGNKQPALTFLSCFFFLSVYSSTLDDNLGCSDKQSKCSFSGNDCGRYPSLRWEPLLTPALSWQRYFLEGNCRFRSLREPD